MNGHYRDLEELVRVFLNGNIHGMLLSGEGGMGKTYNALRVLNDEDVSFVREQGYSTPLSLYNLLRENPDSLIFLDDFQGALENAASLSILKAAMETSTDERVISWRSTTERLEEHEKEFEFTGKIILCVNGVREENADLQAVASRCYHYATRFGYEERMEMIEKMIRANSDGDVDELVEYLWENTSEATENLNLRTGLKALEIYDVSDCWKFVISSMLQIDEEALEALRLAEEYDTREEAAEAFAEKTGLTKRTFYNRLP